MQRLKSACAAVVIGAGLLGPGLAVMAHDASQGVKVGRPSLFRHLVSAEQIEQTGQAQYAQLVTSAERQGARLPGENPQVKRLKAIFARLLPHAAKFNERAKSWAWEVNVFQSRTLNAFCMPGGKIAFYSGLLEGLKLSDDEVALVLGHEIAHALREHARERLGKQMATQGGAFVIGLLTGSQLALEAARGAGSLLSLKFSRDDETEADLVGMELAARAGYDPRAGIGLWTKMAQAAKGAPPQWLSTHPNSESRIATFKKNLPDVLPLYDKAKGGPALAPAQ